MDKATKAIMIEKVRKKTKEKWASLSAEERAERKAAQSAGMREYWKRLSPIERAMITKKREETRRKNARKG